MSELRGESFVGYTRVSGTESCGEGVNPVTGETLSPTYFRAPEEAVERAVLLAESAFPEYAGISGSERAGFLRAIASRLEAAVEEIAVRGPSETGLPEARMRGETGRTCGQLRMFAHLIEEGSWVDARIDRAQPDRQPLPKADLRSMLVPVGPVAVFCASNFPLAFSVAGGDTASALAAGCPVVVIAHEAHPGLAEIAGRAVIEAAQETGMPEGVFSLLYGGGRNIGKEVVTHPAIKAVGFTGSRAGGSALMAMAASRPEPIPVFAEMSSINPLVILPGALAKGEEALAEAYFGSLTMGVGQFCTNPGLVFLPAEGGDAFLGRLAELVAAAPAGTMLHEGILRSYQKGCSQIAEVAGVETLARGVEGAGAVPVVHVVSAADFLDSSELQAEVFGPAAVIVRGSTAETTEAIRALEGQLTCTLHATPEELSEEKELVAALRGRCGRLLFGGFPTGVEVCPSMVHGGPFPATSDGRSSSVGTLAIGRFCRQVAWQSFPDAALPAELQEANPLGIRRTEG
ncbi:NADP-dependent aldehyde dehydrogenase [Haloferula luteola]|uniref:NADP-dependent aldehyde dehydrogenase n=1 Tax=Haloferula luteola TaxID=595692 RepID=A0A840UZ99_9BACT|nr:aldehyde dehydrogenase (NADP(+)) [Haloferula luteola]MBB5350323.1 NADP-dependent aldehyde dehydrogenase [Haloferula luteola]